MFAAHPTDYTTLPFILCTDVGNLISAPACTQCVIGAGAAGLVAARELLREGHSPTIFEQGSRPGGVWVYTDDVEEGAAPVGAPVHSSMYRNLRTNLPREVMSYSDFPFTRVWRDARRFCGHEEVRLQ